MTSPLPPLLHDELPQRSVGARVLRWLLLLLVPGAIVAAVIWWTPLRNTLSFSTSSTAPTHSAPIDTLARAPQGVRIRVRVVNATGINGLAKRATNDLRDRGFDVVDFDAERKMKDYRATTLIQTHTGHADWSERVHRVFGVGTVESRPDSSRYIDLTVIIGSDWKPPAQSFRP